MATWISVTVEAIVSGTDSDSEGVVSSAATAGASAGTSPGSEGSLGSSAHASTAIAIDVGGAGVSAVTVGASAGTSPRLEGSLESSICTSTVIAVDIGGARVSAATPVSDMAPTEESLITKLSAILSDWGGVLFGDLDASGGCITITGRSLGRSKGGSGRGVKGSAGVGMSDRSWSGLLERPITVTAGVVFVARGEAGPGEELPTR